MNFDCVFIKVDTEVEKKLFIIFEHYFMMRTS